MMQRSARRFNRAIEDFQLCLEINPNCYEALWNKSLTHLMIGEYEIGWKLYEYRWNTKISRLKDQIIRNHCGQAMSR